MPVNSMTYPRYDAYKPSGSKWLEEIPSHWHLEKLGPLLRPVSIKGQPDLPLLSITRQHGVIVRDVDDQDANHNFIPDDLSGYKVIKPGQFGMNKMKAWQGSYGVSKYLGLVSPAYFIFDFTREVLPEFFHVAIRSRLYVSFFAGASDGVRVGQWDLSKPRMKAIPFMVPPPEEQASIAQFLGENSEKIDDAIESKEKQIALLEEYKRSTIRMALTGGSISRRAVRQSGIDWIGEIPSHWDVVPGLAVMREKKVSNKGMKQDRVLSLSYGDIVIKSDEKMHGLMPESFETYQIVNRGDVIVRCTDLQNDQTSLRTGLSRHDGIITSAYLNLNAINGYLPEFLHLYLHYLDISKAIYKFGSGLRQNLSWEDFKRLPVILLPLREQQEIVDFVARQSEKIDQAISYQKELIKQLSVYRATLIDATVTGKIKVL